MENNDCATLPLQALALDLDGGWVSYARPKTGVVRRCPLWPETSEQLRLVLEERREPQDPANAKLVFLTRMGACWVNGKENAISHAFRKLATKLKLKRSFYDLRHTFQTIGDEAKDPLATSHIMGHKDTSMAAHYREKISDERLEAVSNHVRTWLHGEA